ncbi:hypothetical protein [Streptomyces phaeochromogenes]|uniref:hypothetical protein n=1 Tax=Streptomyces phaeochromogenes TaxID=1923 RepID=UPI00386F62E1|nr:hypothetical protein OHB08_00610 [Streptomyces phaeochromogenes]
MDAIETINEHWPELSPLLDAPRREELLEIVADAESDPEAAADALRDLIKPLLPPGHPVREALTPSGWRFRPAESPAQDRPALLESFRTLRTRMTSAGILEVGHVSMPYTLTSTTAASTPPPYRPDSRDAWLLEEPALPATALDGLAPEQADQVIVLTGNDEVERVPAFQLDPESRTPYPVVVEINRLLSADEDPWGAADWWLGSNVWLDTAPARLLGRGVDHALLSAARAEIPEW